MQVKGSPFDIDWTDLNAVYEYAKRLGPGMTIFVEPTNGKNYCITHTSRTERYAGCVVMGRT